MSMGYDRRSLPTGSRKLELAAFGFALALVLFVEYLGYRSAEAQVETAGLVDHTHEVLGELDGVLIASIDAETGRRGFALTGDDALLQPYRDAEARATAHLASLRVLVNDNPPQVARLDDVEPRVKNRLRVLDEAVAEQQRAGRHERVQQAADTLRGSDEMNAVRVGLAAMVATERSLLAEREARTAESVKLSRTAQLAGAALSIVLLSLVVFRLQRALREREESERRARDQEADLAITLESIGDGVIATDAEGIVTRINPVAQQITGWEISSAVGKPIEEVFHLVHETKAHDVPNPVQDALRTKAIVEIDDAAVLLAKDGHRRRVADSAAPIRGPDGAVRGAVLVFRDITKTLEDARSLRRTHAFLDSILENIPDMVFVKDAQDLAFVRFNRAGEALLGLKREELIGKTDFAFFAPDQAKAFVDKDRETLRGKVLVDIPEEPLTTAGGIRWLHTKKVPVLGDNGEPEYLLGISADITERRRDEFVLRHSKEATEAAHRDLEAFSYSVAHDLRAPLRSIDGFSQALLEDHGDKLDEEGKSHLLRVRKAAQRMAELIDDLLALARVSRSELARTSVDLSTLAGEVGDQARSARNPKAELVVAEALTVRADPRLVRVLLENLLGNAFKFSSKRDDARIEVGQRTENGEVVTFVKDNGAGFDLAAAKKLFTAFQRYHRPNEYEGTGIGLATAQRIVSRHGGRIWAESTPGGGSTFSFVLETPERTP
jgi:PAS domain S-box-containing protein